jgi:hypothetical protein
MFGKWGSDKLARLLLFLRGGREKMQVVADSCLMTLMKEGNELLFCCCCCKMVWERKMRGQGTDSCFMSLACYSIGLKELVGR